MSDKVSRDIIESLQRRITELEDELKMFAQTPVGEIFKRNKELEAQLETYRKIDKKRFAALMEAEAQLDEVRKCKRYMRLIDVDESEAMIFARDIDAITAGVSDIVIKWHEKELQNEHNGE